jgi:hypothetical protein
MVRGSRLAPTTAIDRGESSLPMERASARCSRDCITAIEAAVGSIGKTRWMASSPYERVAW